MLTAHACTTSHDQNENMSQEPTARSPQIWKLTTMSGNMVNSETTGDDMAWQETIELYRDNTFRKIREENGNTAKATGKYTFEEKSDGKYLVLHYDSKSALIANCTSDLLEYIKVESDDRISGTWLACDGPGLIYTLSK